MTTCRRYVYSPPAISLAVKACLRSQTFLGSCRKSTIKFHCYRQLLTDLLQLSWKDQSQRRRKATGAFSPSTLTLVDDIYVLEWTPLLPMRCLLKHHYENQVLPKTCTKASHTPSQIWPTLVPTSQFYLKSFLILLTSQCELVI